MSTFTGTLADLTPVGHTPTSAELGTWYDELLALTDAWTDYSASLAWTATTTNPAIGNGTITAYYKQIGKTVHFRGRILMGSTSTFGSGSWRISLPAAARDTIYGGAAFCFDSSTTANQQIATMTFSSTTLAKVFAAGAGTVVDATTPFAWASADVLAWDMVYEAA